MSIGSLILLIGTIALVLTLISVFLRNRKRNWFLAFLQYFCGTLFVISGYVKAVDPLGTAYKMEQYFAEFASTFEGLGWSSFAQLFPWMADQSIIFALIMIILEIILGIMLILGVWKRFTVWAFFLIIVFFTILTGFTFLTGYVPSEVNFFSFSQWSEFKASNMRVTDCGCFGDFIKLEPRTSFLKDIILLAPALLFLFTWRSFHTFFTPQVRRILTLVLGLLVTWFCFRNFAWDLPVTDFRPFAVGAHIRDQKIAEEDAMANVEITDWLLEHNETGEQQVVPNDTYLANYKTYRGTWKVIEQIKSEPSIPITKISDFEMSSEEGSDMTGDILDRSGPHFMIVSHHLPVIGTASETTMVQDTIWAADTIVIDRDTQIVQRIEQIDQRAVVTEDFSWSERFSANVREKINPLIEAGGQDVPGYLVTAYTTPEMLADFRKDHQFTAPIFLADDILLKTIVRSNPGVVLWRDGQIIAKWHIKQLPDFEEIKAEFLQQ